MGGRRSALACGDEPADETDDGADETLPPLRCLGKNRRTRNLGKEDEEDEWDDGERWDVTVVEDADAGEALEVIVGVGLEGPRCFIEERRGGGGSANGRDDNLS